MPRNNLSSARRFCLASLVLLCCAAARGDALTPEVREARRQEIARKSESERARLQRNFKAFRELPPAEQEWLRQFARELKDDDRGEGKLRPVMNEYHEWLLTLTPGQAEDLRREADPNRRDKQVRDLLKKQQELADATGTKAGAKEPNVLSLEDLDAVMGIMEQAIRKFMSPEEIELLKKKHGVARHTFILDMAFRPRGVGGPQPLLAQWWSKEVLEAMVSAVTNPRQKNQLRTDAARGPRFILVQLLMAGINAEYEVEHEKIKPDQDTLERFFVQLSSAEQDEIMRLPFDQQQKKLLDTYLTKKSLEDPENFPKPPQFPWLRRLQQQIQAAQRAGNRPGEPPRVTDDAAAKENSKKKNGKEKGKGKPGKSPNDAE